METTHQKDKSISSNAKWLFKPNCFYSPLWTQKGATLHRHLPPPASKGPPGRVCQLCPGFGSGSSSWALVWGDGGGGLVYSWEEGKKAVGLQEWRWRGWTAWKERKSKLLPTDSSWTLHVPLEAEGLAPTCPSCCNRSPAPHTHGPFAGELLVFFFFKLLLCHVIWPWDTFVPTSGWRSVLSSSPGWHPEELSHPVREGGRVSPPEGTPLAFL